MIEREDIGQGVSVRNLLIGVKLCCGIVVLPVIVREGYVDWRQPYGMKYSFAPRIVLMCIADLQ